MDRIEEISDEDLTTTAASEFLLSQLETEVDSSFQDTLALIAEETVAAETASLDTFDESLSELEQSGEDLAQDDTDVNQEEFSEDVTDVLEETSKALDEIDTEDYSDLEDLDEIQDKLETVADDLGKLAEETTSEIAADLLETGGEAVDLTGKSVDGISEIAKSDTDLAEEMLDQLTGTLTEVVKVAQEILDPLKSLQAATSILQRQFDSISNALEKILSYSVLSAAISESDEEVLQRQIAEQRHLEVSNTEAATSSGNATVQFSGSSDIDLSGWKLTLPVDRDGDGGADEMKEAELAAMFSGTAARAMTASTNASYSAARHSAAGNENIHQNQDGSITFSSKSSDQATTANSKYPRSELREMIRSGDTSIGTHDPQNNWVTSASPAADQKMAGGVDGQMTATLSVDRVTTQGSAEQAGRVIIGQIHAQNDEPLRLYYHKAPGSKTGAIYFAHEPQNGKPETFHMLIGDKSGHAANGIALGEAFSYDINMRGNELTVSVTKKNGQTFSETLDISSSGYSDPGTMMYFKAGVYSQNNTTPDPENDYAEATFYSLETAHNGEPITSRKDPNTVFEKSPSPGTQPGTGGGVTGDPSSGVPGDPSGGNFGGAGGGVPGTGNTTGSTTGTTTGGTTGTTGSGGLSSTADPADINASDSNQAALEARFIALYERLMEKQISFKEAIEPYKTDNQNAGKG